MLVLSTGIGTISGAVGMMASYHLDIQSGPAIVLTSAVVFGCVYAVTAGSDRRRAGHAIGETDPVGIAPGASERPTETVQAR
jgi:hypothetical protein